MNAIKPGQSVAQFRLPLPVSGMSAIADLIEHLYGAGETMMNPRGDVVEITAPKDGFGPRTTPAPVLPGPDADDMLVSHMAAEDGELELTYEMDPDLFGGIADNLVGWFEAVGGINYVTLDVKPIDGDSEFVFTLQRKAGLTPHDARQAAERRVSELEEEVARLTKELAGATPDAT
ncbi:hypothetical protein [Agromyces humi]|uniref:hypothetical protein n=1 Tax=Agromyces humi TaxID=1766800 RepID=UPI0013592EEC|nr:hypothetical protein [Agromyces humi]